MTELNKEQQDRLSKIKPGQTWGGNCNVIVDKVTGMHVHYHWMEGDKEMNYRKLFWEFLTRYPELKSEIQQHEPEFFRIDKHTVYDSIQSLRCAIEIAQDTRRDIERHRMPYLLSGHMTTLINNKIGQMEKSLGLLQKCVDDNYPKP